MRILLRRIHLFLGLPDQLVRDMDPDPSPDPTIIKQKYVVRKTLLPTVLRLFIFKNYLNVPSKRNFLLTSWRSLTKIAGTGSASGSIVRGMDPPIRIRTNMDPQHRFILAEHTCNTYSQVRIPNTHLKNSSVYAQHSEKACCFKVFLCAQCVQV